MCENKKNVVCRALLLVVAVSIDTRFPILGDLMLPYLSYGRSPYLYRHEFVVRKGVLDETCCPFSVVLHLFCWRPAPWFLIIRFLILCWGHPEESSRSEGTGRVKKPLPCKAPAQILVSFKRDISQTNKNSSCNEIFLTVSNFNSK